MSLKPLLPWAAWRYPTRTIAGAGPLMKSASAADLMERLGGVAMATAPGSPPATFLLTCYGIGMQRCVVSPGMVEMQ